MIHMPLNIWHHIYVNKTSIGFYYKQKTPKVVNNGRNTWQPLGEIVLLDSRTSKSL
jgi:hypothetical protein